MFPNGVAVENQKQVVLCVVNHLNSWNIRKQNSNKSLVLQDFQYL